MASFKLKLCKGCEATFQMMQMAVKRSESTESIASTESTESTNTASTLQAAEMESHMSKKQAAETQIPNKSTKSSDKARPSAS